MQQVSPFQAVADLTAAQTFEVGGLSSLFETLSAALLQPVEPARRHVVIARTKGIDTISLVDARAVRAIAERSDALFHLVLMEGALANEEARWAFQCLPLPSGPPPPVGNPTAGTTPPTGTTPPAVPPAAGGPPVAVSMSPPIPTGITNVVGACWPTSRSWRPSSQQLITLPDFAITLDGLHVKAGVEATGGRWHQTVGFSEPSLLGTFRQTFENFRTNYILRYTPRGVTREGWHAIEVKVPRFRDYKVSARKGYGIDELPPAPPPPAPVAVPRTLPELTVAYDRSAYQAVASSLRQMGDTARLMKELESAGNPWPATPRREAAFVLEVAEPSVFSSRIADREAALRVLERFTRLIRDPLEPVMFERYWHFAVLSQLQGAMHPAVAKTFVDRALVRFPSGAPVRPRARDYRGPAGVLESGPAGTGGRRLERSAGAPVLRGGNGHARGRSRGAHQTGMASAPHGTGGGRPARAAGSRDADHDRSVPPLSARAVPGHRAAVAGQLDRAVAAFRAALSSCPRHSRRACR